MKSCHNHIRACRKSSDPDKSTGISTLSANPLLSIADTSLSQRLSSNNNDFENATSQIEVDEIMKLLSEMVEKTKVDFESGVFKEFHPYQTKTGFYLGTLKEAMEFNNYHEGIHLGIMMTIKKYL